MRSVADRLRYVSYPRGSNINLVCAVGPAGNAQREMEAHNQEHEPDEAPDEAKPDIGAPDESPAADTPPALPSEDDSALGDTDQHSDA